MSTYYSALYLRRNADDIRRIITLSIFYLSILAAVQLLRYAAGRAVPEYYAGSLRSDNVVVAMLFRLATPLIDVLSQFGFSKTAEKIIIDSVLTALAFHRVTKVDWFSSGDPDDFLANDFPTSTMRDNSADSLAPVKRQKVDDGPVRPVLAPAADVEWLAGVTRKTIANVKRDYRRYLKVVEDHCDLQYDVLAILLDGPDDIFAQKAFSENGGSSSFMTCDCSVIATALERLPDTAPTSDSELSNVVQSLFDNI